MMGNFDVFSGVVDISFDLSFFDDCFDFRSRFFVSFVLVLKFS